MKKVGIAAVGALLLTVALTGASHQDNESTFLGGLTACDNAEATHSYGTSVTTGGEALHSYGSGVVSGVC